MIRERPVRLEAPWEVCAVLSAVEAAVKEGRFPADGLDSVVFRARALIRAIEGDDADGWG